MAGIAINAAHGPARACPTDSLPNRPASRSTARVSPSTRGVKPACTCRINRVRNTGRSRTSRRARSSPATSIFYKSPDRSRRHLHRRRLDDPRARAPVTSSRSPLSTGPRSSGSVDPANHRYGVGPWRASTPLGSVPGSTPTSTVPVAVRLRAHRRWSIQPDLRRHRRQRPADSCCAVHRLAQVLATAHDMAREHRIISAVGRTPRAGPASARPVHRRRRQRRAVLRDELRRRSRARQRRARRALSPASAAASQRTPLRCAGRSARGRRRRGRPR